ncbi:hypothetical protein GCM10011297_13050 [Bacterioplanes sanyensis]|nr:hypothetical protein GCM10011297_13050 [Bacterioplanes sanyensis]
MQHYYVSDLPQVDGYHVIHTGDCRRLPLPHSRTYLGAYPFAVNALDQARRFRTAVNGCLTCTPGCYQGVMLSKSSKIS